MTSVRRHHAGPDRRVPFISVARIRELIDSAANAHASIVSFQTRARCGHSRYSVARLFLRTQDRRQTKKAARRKAATPLPFSCSGIWGNRISVS